MPSTYSCPHTLRHDLQAIDEYSRSRHTSKENRKLAHLSMAELGHYFSSYRRNFQTPRRLLPNQKLRKLSSFLYSLYDSQSEPFQYIEDLREIMDLGVCLYCGLPKNFTVDHYLPRDIKAFPHFSTFSLNLIPACSSCQGSKGSFYPKERPGSRMLDRAARRTRAICAHRDDGKHLTGKYMLYNKNRTVLFRSIASKRKKAIFSIQETHRFIHPYFDRFLIKPAFDLHLRWHKDTPRIEDFRWLSHLSGTQRALLSFHVSKLKIKDRSKGYIKRAHKAFANNVIKAKLDQGAIKERIVIMIDNARTKSGVSNSIEESFFRALLQDETRHALLAAQSTKGKQGLVSEAKAMSARAANQLDIRMYGI